MSNLKYSALKRQKLFHVHPAIPMIPITFFSIPIKIPKKDLIGSTFSTPGGTTKAYYRMFSSPIVFDSITAKDFWGHLGDYRYQWRFRVPINGLDNWIDGEKIKQYKFVQLFGKELLNYWRVHIVEDFHLPHIPV